MASDSSSSSPSPKALFAFSPGSNVNAVINKKERGPFYLVQIVGEVATLQGKESIEVPVSDLRALTD